MYISHTFIIQPSYWYRNNSWKVEPNVFSNQAGMSYSIALLLNHSLFPMFKGRRSTAVANSAATLGGQGRKITIKGE